MSNDARTNSLAKDLNFKFMKDIILTGVSSNHVKGYDRFDVT